MKTITLGKLTQIANGKLIKGNPSTLISSLNFGRPSYLISSQVYFYAKNIKWEKQLAAILSKGPLAVVLPLDLSIPTLPPSTSIIRVSNAYSSYWKLALWNWKQYSPRVIGITGSSGKSTTTEMVYSILKRKWQIVKTQGNLNTYSFLPDYLTKLTGKHHLLLLEMGMKSLNNIKRQCDIVKPEIGVVTNIGEAHVGSLGNLDIIVKAKQEIIDGLRSDGTMYINLDDLRSQKLKTNQFKGKVKTFAINSKADIQGKNVRYTPKGMVFDAVIEMKSYPIFIPTFGIHNVYNALAAIGMAMTYGAPIKEIQQGLSVFQMPKMRLQFIRRSNGKILINDAWNANPTAMVAGLNVLKNIAHGKPTIAVLGDMLELGNLTTSSHTYIGKYVAQLGISQLVTLGRYGKQIAASAIQSGMEKSKVFSFYNKENLIRHLSRSPAHSIIYFKASRKLYLEKVIKLLK